MFIDFKHLQTSKNFNLLQEKIKNLHSRDPHIFWLISRWSSRKTGNFRRETDLRKIREEENRKLIIDLQAALDDVILHGIIPICASCKQIRDDEGYWNQVERYIHQHTHAKFSHTICPDCSKKLYPDLDIF